MLERPAKGQNEASVDEVILVKATRGDKVIVPPNYVTRDDQPVGAYAEDGNLGVPVVRVGL